MTGRAQPVTEHRAVRAAGVCPVTAPNHVRLSAEESMTVN
jgi:hypothetical protein